MPMSTKKPNPTKTNYLVDLAIFLAFLIAMEPNGTGIAIHEWLGLAFGAAIITHLLLHWQWIAAITRRFFSKIAAEARINYILNVLFFVDMTLIVFTGVMISKAVLPLFGLQVAEGTLWRHLHSVTADAGILILGLHLGLHGRWIVNVTRRFFTRRARSAQTAPQTTQSEEVSA